MRTPTRPAPPSAVSSASAPSSAARKRRADRIVRQAAELYRQARGLDAEQSGAVQCAHSRGRETPRAHAASAGLRLQRAGCGLQASNGCSGLQVTRAARQKSVSPSRCGVLAGSSLA